MTKPTSLDWKGTQIVHDCESHAGKGLTPRRDGHSKHFWRRGTGSEMEIFVMKNGTLYHIEGWYAKAVSDWYTDKEIHRGMRKGNKFYRTVVALMLAGF